MERTIQALQKCTEWAINNNLQLGNRNSQIKKVAEELTEAFIHLSYGQSIDDDIGDILIATNTYLTIENWQYGKDVVDLVVESFARLIVTSYTGDNQSPISKEEWRDEYFLPLIAELYDDRELEKTFLTTTVLLLVGSFAGNRHPAVFIEAAYNEIKNRIYTNSFDKKEK